MNKNPCCPCCGGTFCPNDFVCTSCGAPFEAFEFPEMYERTRVVIDPIVLPRIAGLSNDLWLVYSDGPLSDEMLAEALRIERPPTKWLSTFRRLDGSPVRELAASCASRALGSYRTRVLVVSTPRVTSIRDVLEAHCVDMVSSLTSLSGDHNA